MDENSEIDDMDELSDELYGMDELSDLDGIPLDKSFFSLDKIYYVSFDNGKNAFRIKPAEK